MGLFKDSGKRAKRKKAGKARVSKGGAALTKRRRNKAAKNRRQGRW